MKGFTLVDKQFQTVQCICFGESAYEDAIHDDSEIVIFYCQGRAGQGGESGKIWIYDDAHISNLGVNKLPAGRKLVEMHLR